VSGLEIETLEQQYGREFDMKYIMWRSLKVSFPELYPDIHPDAGGSYDPEDLMLVDYSKVITWFEGQNTQHELGFFPLLAKRDLADNLSSSFVERVNSAAELVMGNGRTLLHEDELGKLVVLRINREAIKALTTWEEAQAQKDKAALKSLQGK